MGSDGRHRFGARRRVARRALAALALLCAFGASCQTRRGVSIPSFGGSSQIAGAPKPPPPGLKWLAGVYEGPSDRFGADPVVHATRDTVSVFTSAAVTYAITQPGCLEGGTRLVLEGYWRRALDTSTGLVRIEVLPRAVAEAVCKGTAATAPAGALPSPVFDVVTGDGDALPDAPSRLERTRSTPPVPSGFEIIAHHGACRTIDECGTSENSLESIRAVESFGASVVEVDVRLTRDGIPILFHDETLAPRLVSGPFCHGVLAELPLQHLRANCTLEHGEQIPTLDEALRSAVEETELRGVWLDVKVPEAVRPTLASMAKSLELARAKGRSVDFLIGLATAETLEAYRALPVAERGPCLVELEPSDVVSTGCKAWAPRWTRGPMVDDVRAMQARGLDVYFWTLDEIEFLDLFAQTARPNGILTDRAGLVLHRFHTIYAKDGTWP